MKGNSSSSLPLPCHRKYRKCHSVEQLTPKCSEKQISPSMWLKYETLSYCTGTNWAAEDIIFTFPYCCSDVILKNMKMFDRYVMNDQQKWTHNIEDTSCFTNCRVYMIIYLNFEWLYSDQPECRNFSLKDFALAYDNISWIIINIRAWPSIHRRKCCSRPNHGISVRQC